MWTVDPRDPELPVPFSESSLSEESLLPEDEEPVFVTVVVSGGFSSATQNIDPEEHLTEVT